MSKGDYSVVSPFPPEPGPRAPVEQRGLKDRRSRPTRCFSRYTLTGRRKAARRNDEASNYYVDRFEPKYLLIFGLTLAMCALDCGLSVKIHQWGGAEVNWLAAGLFEGNLVLLFSLKLTLTLICLVFLIVHKNFKVLGLLRSGDAVYFLFAVYLVLSVYELYAVLAIKDILSVP